MATSVTGKAPASHLSRTGAGLTTVVRCHIWCKDKTATAVTNESKESRAESKEAKEGGEAKDGDPASSAAAAPYKPKHRIVVLRVNGSTTAVTLGRILRDRCAPAGDDGHSSAALYLQHGNRLREAGAPLADNLHQSLCALNVGKVLLQSGQQGAIALAGSGNAAVQSLQVPYHESGSNDAIDVDAQWGGSETEDTTSYDTAEYTGSVGALLAASDVWVDLLFSLSASSGSLVGRRWASYCSASGGDTNNSAEDEEGCGSDGEGGRECGGGGE